ncbi:cysteine desulphurase family member, partial [Naegleria gruberi]
MSLIYLDYNATTPIDVAVSSAMIPYMTQHFGNPSSSHHYGTITKKAVTRSRIQVSQLLNCHPDEVIFTSGGTESNNYAIKNALLNSSDRIIHCITSRVEHPSVMEVFKFLEQRYSRVRVTYCGVDENGTIRLDEFKNALSRETLLVSVMHSNNEVGTLQPIREIGKLIRSFEKENQMERNSIILHTDAAQKDITPVHLLSVCTHKFYGPKGVGALFIRRNCGIQLEKQVHGASVHERGYRSGTENVILVVGLGKACEQCLIHMVDRVEHMFTTREKLYNGLLNNLSNIVQIKLNGHPEKRLPNTLNISFAGIEANTILDDLSQHIAASAGSACHSSSHEEGAEKKIVISQILAEMGVDVNIAMGTIRFSTGLLLTNDEVESAIHHVTDTISKL